MDTSCHPEVAFEARPGRKAACKRRVLVVDDNEDIAESSALLLKCHGHDVTTAFDGRDAIDRARSFRPDVALLDVGLPDINGYEVARRLRAEFGPGVILIIITAYAREFRRDKIDNGVFDHFFMKPLDFAVLADLLA
jgi:two-component system CheB/CheR fusion protein